MNPKEAAKRAGVSVRTLRYYEEMNLILPVRNAENDYRNYDESMMERVRLIRAYRELQFSLDEIKVILSADRMTRDKILEEQIARLETRKQRIENRIALARNLRAMGSERFAQIDFETVDDQMKLAQDALAENQEWQALNEKFKAQTEEQSEKMAQNLLQHLADIVQAEENDVQTAIQKLKIYMEENLYPATPEILQYYANAFGGDGLLAQAVEEIAGEGAAKVLKERLKRSDENTPG